MVVLAALTLATHPVVIAHRGASAHRPEHTLSAYELAIDMGADFIEPDLVVTKDGVLVARHENDITRTTDVADHPEFAVRRTKKRIDGQEIDGWFVEDFTLAEIKTLRAKESLPNWRIHSAWRDGRYEIPTLDEIIGLLDRKRSHAGIYPEVKHPTYFRSIGLPLEDRLVSTLRNRGFGKGRRPVFIQSFEVDSLKRLRKMTDAPLIQLIQDAGAPFDQPQTPYASMLTPEGLTKIATYADGIGVAKSLVIPRDRRGSLTEPTPLVDTAHRLGLLVHAWTFRDEDYFLPRGLKGKPREEVERYVATGLDGVFMDNPFTWIGRRR